MISFNHAASSIDKYSRCFIFSPTKHTKTTSFIFATQLTFKFCPIFELYFPTKPESTYLMLLPIWHYFWGDERTKLDPIFEFSHAPMGMFFCCWEWKKIGNQCSHKSKGRRDGNFNVTLMNHLSPSHVKAQLLKFFTILLEGETRYKYGEIESSQNNLTKVL